MDYSQEDWARQTAEEAGLHRPYLRRLTAAVGDATPEDRCLRAALSALGCKLEREWRPGIVAFHAQRGGFSSPPRTSGARWRTPLSCSP